MSWYLYSRKEGCSTSGLRPSTSNANATVTSTSSRANRKRKHSSAFVSYFPTWFFVVKVSTCHRDPFKSKRKHLEFQSRKKLAQSTQLMHENKLIKQSVLARENEKSKVQTRNKFSLQIHCRWPRKKVQPAESNYRFHAIIRSIWDEKWKMKSNFPVTRYSSFHRT